MGGRRGAGGVRPEAAGIQIDFRWRGRRWRPTLDLAPTPANLRYAERVRAEIVERIRHGTFRFADYFPDARCAPPEGPAAATTFAAYAELWLKAQGALEASTLRGYRSALDAHLLPRFGERRLDGILHSELAGFFGGYWSSAKVRNNVLIPARGVFGMALRDGVTTRDPLAGVRNARHQAPPPDPFELAEAEAIVAKLREMYGIEAEYFEVAFWTGMRTSELIELRWGDVDLPAGTALVSRARVSGVEKGTKTHAARLVELNSRVRAALERLRPVSQLAGGHVFLNPNTKAPYPDDQLPRRRFKAALRALSMRQRDAYNTRHSYASWCLTAGLKPAWVARQLGHSVEVLLRRYARWIAADDAGREARRFEEELVSAGSVRDPVARTRT